MVDAVGRNRSGRWEDHLWTGRDRGEREGEKKGKRGRRKKREGEKERGGDFEEHGHFCGGIVQASSVLAWLAQCPS